MSKRWKVRKKNAEKLERSCEITEQFYDNLIKRLKELEKKERQREENLHDSIPNATASQP